MEIDNIQNISLRLYKLEGFYSSLSTQLKGEISLRQVENEKSYHFCEYLKKQYENKNKQTEDLIKKKLESLKTNINNYIDFKINEKFINEKNQMEKFSINNIEKLNQINNLDNTTNKKYLCEFEQYRAELNKITEKIGVFENLFVGQIEEISAKIEEIIQNMNNLKINDDQLFIKMNDVTTAFNSLKEEKNNNIKQINNEIKEQINNLNNSIDSKINNMSSKQNEERSFNDVNSISNDLNYLKNDFNSLSNNYLREINEVKKDFNEQNKIKDKEINNFEQHLLNEYEKFTKFITGILNQNVDKIKSMNDYLNSDIDIIKNKNQYLEDTLIKLREDIYDSIEKNSKFIMDKIHTYLGNNQQINVNNIANKVN